MKLFFTITDVGAVVHAGGSPEMLTYEYVIENDSLPEGVQQYLKLKDNTHYCQLSISFNKEK